jgi:hypothetical protein
MEEKESTPHRTGVQGQRSTITVVRYDVCNSGKIGRLLKALHPIRDDSDNTRDQRCPLI